MPIKKYSVVASDTDITAISLVELPAVESNFIALSKEERKQIDFQIQNEEKREIVGVALRADFDIYRRYGEDEYYITFSKDAVRRLATKFMKNYLQKNFTTDHMGFQEGLTVIESWFVEDVNNDKANALGLQNFSEGSWIVGVKVDDDEVWHSIKEGKWQGFSIEAWCELEEMDNFSKIKDNSNEDMNNENKILETLNEIKALLKKEEPVEEPQVTEEVVETKLEEEKPVEEPVEEPKTEEPVEEKLEEEKPVEEPKEDEPVEENLSETVEQLKSEIETLKTENTELKGKVEKMGKMPSVEPNTTPSGEKKFSAIEQLDKLGFIKW